MKRILLVAYSYPPLWDPQSIRWFHLSNLLAQKGYKIDIFTVKLPEAFFKERIDIHENIDIHRIFSGFIEGMFFNVKSTIKTDSLPGETRRSRSFVAAKKAAGFIRKLSDNVMIGDRRSEWFFFCVSYLEKLDLSIYDVLITSQEPFVSSLVGLYVKRKRPDIKWIADFGDSIVSVYYPSWRKPLDMYFEKKVAEKADAVLLTSRNLRVYLSVVYSIEKSKFIVLGQGFSFDRLKRRSKTKNNLFTMLFSGTFYKGFREPYALIEALKELDIDYRIIIAGRNEMFMDPFAELGDKVEFKGFVPYYESLRLQEEADLLINISNKHTYQVPGKFFEYLGARKPILNIVYSKADETYMLPELLGVGVSCFNDRESIKRAVMKMYASWNRKADEQSKREVNNLFEFSWEYKSEILQRLIDG